MTFGPTKPLENSHSFHIIMLLRSHIRLGNRFIETELYDIFFAATSKILHCVGNYFCRLSIDICDGTRPAGARESVSMNSVNTRYKVSYSTLD